MGNKGGKSGKPTQPPAQGVPSVQPAAGRPAPAPAKQIELSEADYSFLVSQTGLSRGEIKDVFVEFMSNNPDAVLNKSEFIKLYNKLRPESPERLDEIAAFIFKAFDTDHNGSVTFNEFMIAYSLTSRGDTKKKLEYAFSLYDADNNGYLDRNEVREVIFGMLDLLGADKKTHNPVELSEQIIKDLDSTQDGKISKTEFIEGLAKNYSLRALMSPFN